VKQEHPQLVTTKEAAMALGLSQFFLYRNSSVFPGAYRAGKAIRWDVAQLKAWMASQASRQHNDEHASQNFTERETF